ncbi:hypothetical protein JXA02_03735 [candidate division KSB1 bacterium]|nr:hypothetical protein [candidate division KSB1 bacterium]RQW09284.1 MAG: hypothetical protein EH222_04200 [candidate division KSB1 bacterium]
MQSINRRSFVKSGVFTAAALATPCPLAAFQDLQSIEHHLPGRKARVAAIRGDNLDSMTREAVAALGEMCAIVHEGETVFIKPNFVSFPWARDNNCFHAGECTKPERMKRTSKVQNERASL